jgi:ABC-2 type transport system permease protein/lipopolysaccharide transport system permease protein
LTDTGTVLISGTRAAEIARLPSKVALATADLTEGLRHYWLWLALGQQDIRLRYRGSLLGPFWQTLTTAVMIAGMGVIYSQLFHIQLENYLPLLALGLIFWLFVSSLVTEGCNTFISAQPIIQQVKLPYSIHVYRLIYRNLLTLGHNIVIVPIVLWLYPPPVQPLQLVSLVPGLALVLLNGGWIGLLLGMLSARFRDVPPIVGSVMQVVFFITPVMWSVASLGGNAWWVELNPIFAMIDVLRAPLLGMPVSPYSWPLLVGMTGIGCALSFGFFIRFRHRLAFWV